MIIGRDNRFSRRALLLVELLMYIALLSFILILAAVIFNQFLNQSASLRRNISDIERTLKAGERWRADMRTASGPPHLNGNALIIPQTNGNLIYTLGRTVSRQPANLETKQIALTGARTNEFIVEQRGAVSVWRWEIELDHRRKDTRVRPLFTFMAVAGSN